MYVYVNILTKNMMTTIIVYGGGGGGGDDNDDDDDDYDYEKMVIFPLLYIDVTGQLERILVLQIPLVVCENLHDCVVCRMADFSCNIYEKYIEIFTLVYAWCWFSSCRYGLIRLTTPSFPQASIWKMIWSF